MTNILNAAYSQSEVAGFLVSLIGLGFNSVSLGVKGAKSIIMNQLFGKLVPTNTADSSCS